MHSCSLTLCRVAGSLNRVRVEPLRLNSRIVIPADELRLSYARSRGPGGQNVNKVASKAVLRFNLRASPSIPEAARQRALAALASRLTANGEIILVGNTYRDQGRNRAAVLERLAKLLSDAVRPVKTRIPTRPSRYVVEQRIADKRAHGRQKKERRGLTGHSEE